MVRVCFNRKNKTCRATFLNKKLLQLMLSNSRSLHEVSMSVEKGKGKKKKGKKSHSKAAPADTARDETETAVGAWVQGGWVDG